MSEASDSAASGGTDGKVTALRYCQHDKQDRHTHTHTNTGIQTLNTTRHA